MSQDWKLRVQPAERKPFVFRATLVSSGPAGHDGILESRYLYGDGDLAVLLEDLGAAHAEIWGMLETLRGERAAEILLDVNEEAMEVLSQRSRAFPE